MTRLSALGDRAFLARFDTEDLAARWAEAVRHRRVEGVADVVLAYASVGVYATNAVDDLDSLEANLTRIEPADSTGRRGRLVEIPVCYDGPDLEEVAQRLGSTPAEVATTHGSADYRVFAVGFRPGFPYAGYLPPALEGLPRRSPPRTRVAAGSVAIVGRQTAVYPVDSPGGWHLIGRTPLIIADMARGHFPIRAGDWLRFVAIDPEEYDRRHGELLEP